MPRISYKDNCNRLEDIINNNNNIQYICGNPLILSILISIIVILIVNLNYNNCFAQLLYSVLFIMPLILLENKIIKNCYIIRGRGENNIFEGSSDITGGKKTVIPPRNFIINKNTKTYSEGSSEENDKKLLAELLDV